LISCYDLMKVDLMINPLNEGWLYIRSGQVSSFLRILLI
jgi:hypothetical protein